MHLHSDEAITMPSVSLSVSKPKYVRFADIGHCAANAIQKVS